MRAWQEFIDVSRKGSATRGPCSRPRRHCATHPPTCPDTPPPFSPPYLIMFISPPRNLARTLNWHAL